jgi:acetyl esterase/lipase
MQPEMNRFLEFPLWHGLPPGALGNAPERDIPTLTVYPAPPELASGAAVVICPGGGYWELMDGYEGRDFALWLNERGLSAFVLKYRLAAHGYHHPEITNDLLRAIRHVRAHAQDWGIDSNRIGVMGASAGGHLASLAMTHGDKGNSAAEDLVERVSSRPNFGILCYAVISMELWPMTNLLGKSPIPALIRHLSSDLQVTRGTPPCFIWHTQDDKTVSVEHALKFACALQRDEVSFALHIYPSGEHGLGLGVKGYDHAGSQALHPWTSEFRLWLEQQGLTTR